MNEERNDPQSQSDTSSTPGDPSRRKFMAAVMGAATSAYALGIGYVVFRYLTTGIENPDKNLPSEIKVEGGDSLAPNSAKLFKYGSKPGILIRNSEGSYTAYSAVCTHLGCTVQYQADRGRIFCACHGGVYNPDNGDNVAGPPPEPLKEFKVAQKEDGVYVERA